MESSLSSIQRIRQETGLPVRFRFQFLPVDSFGDWRTLSIASYRKSDPAPLGKNDTLQGTLALLVLKTLQQGPMHGWGITMHIQQISEQVLRVEEGSLYPALHRMEQEGWIAAEWGMSDNKRRARYYRLHGRWP